MTSATNATISFENENFPSLPALFGRYMRDGETYQAHLQFLPENPYLCDDTVVLSDSNNSSSFVIPQPISILPNLTIPPQPVALLAQRGKCAFARKAAVAQAIHSTVEFLIVANDDRQGPDILVPMYTEYGDSRLVLLSVTYRAGWALKEYWKEYTGRTTGSSSSSMSSSSSSNSSSSSSSDENNNNNNNINTQQPKQQLDTEGPIIMLDSQRPPNMLTAEDIQEMMLKAIGLFFVLISFSGCVMVALGSYGGANGGAFGTTQYLTEEQVRQFPSPSPEESLSCAICLGEQNDDYDDDDNDDGVHHHHHDEEGNHHSSNEWTELPCHHHFHTDCIVPWLTERQPKCPLCKYDVLQQPAGTDGEDEVIANNTEWLLSRFWMRWTRSRWTQVVQAEEEDEELNNANDDDDNHQTSFNLPSPEVATTHDGDDDDREQEVHDGSHHSSSL